jgi:cytochrome P450
LATAAGVPPHVRVDDPLVMTGLMEHEDGRVFAWFISQHASPVAVSPRVDGSLLTLDGEPLSDIDIVSYYVIIATAGHDTTSAVISGGLQALIENPDQRERLRDNMNLMPPATEEMIRWVTPVKEFMRTAREDTTVRGVLVAAGESVLLSYASANRDDDVFEDPFRFDVGRDPNKHNAFGYGVHFCLGAALARMEVNSFFSELVPRLESIELTGDPQHIATIFVGGLKHLPIRYSLK